MSQPPPKKTDTPAVWPMVIADLEAFKAPTWLVDDRGTL